MAVYYKCKICGEEHRSPIALGDRVAFETSTLIGNKFECPKMGKSEVYDKEDMVWREELFTVLPQMESGPAQVIASGTVISFSGNPVSITYGSPEAPLKLVFDFQDEEGKDKLDVRADTPDPLTLKLTLRNFKNPLGSGTTKPIPIGTLEGRKLYIQYRVYALTKSVDKTLHYTIYTAEEVPENG